FSIVTVFLPRTMDPPLVTDWRQRVTPAVLYGQLMNFVYSPVSFAEALPTIASEESATTSTAAHATPHLLRCSRISATPILLLDGLDDQLLMKICVSFGHLSLCRNQPSSTAGR